MVAASAPTLRLAAPDDVETVAEVWHSGWRDGHIGHVPDTLLPHRQLEDFSRCACRLVSRTRWWAVIADKLVGFVTVIADEVEGDSWPASIIGHSVHSHSAEESLTTSYQGLYSHTISASTSAISVSRPATYIRLRNQ